MATTPGGLPYPVGTDLVVNGDDAIKALADALDVLLLRQWTAWTPVVQDGMAIGNAVSIGAYRKVGRDLTAYGRIGLGTTSGVFGPIQIQLPAGMAFSASANDTLQVVGKGLAQTSTATAGILSLTPSAPTAFFLRTTGGNPIGVGIPGTWAPGNVLSFSLEVEVAA